MALIIITSPEGTGKTTIVYALRKEMPGLTYGINTTTRPARKNEVNGVDYNFITKEEFKQKIDNNEFIEYQKHLGNYYGVQRKEVDKSTKDKPVLISADIFGAIEIKQEKKDDALLIFIRPPSIQEVERRLRKREGASEDEIKSRLARVKMVLTKEDQCDTTIVNDDVNKAIKEAVAIVKGFLDKQNN